MSTMDVEQASTTTTAHHESLYFPDGDLVIASSLEKGTRTLFRVHNFMVARHSPVFRDMLSFPAGESGKTGFYDGSPLVLLHDDVEEIIALLDVFYNPGFPLFRHNDPDFPLLGYKLMKMGRKYQIDTICAAITNHLEQQWPLTEESVRRFLRSREEDEESCFDEWRADPSTKHIWKMYPEPASAIRLAVDFDIPSILPAAFYMLATMTPDQKWPKSEKEEMRMLKADRLARWDLLHERERLTYYESKYKLSVIQLQLDKVFQHSLLHRHDDCIVEWTFDYTDKEDPDGERAYIETETWDAPCTRAADRFISKHFQYQLSPYLTLTHPDPITRLLQFEKSIPTMELCQTCELPAKRHLQEEIKRIWERFAKSFQP
ncbi:hypothetical protein PHLGIDRAFT_429124 [Phlebiopsis gigantea 11061_1 CR5-6]|uniref:BTB domain-containing protein n=1 Tax=Phlebiopsis gigantea (strain 11061_1 CR5-6) TaxID=745531 RepID=A0A0C3NPV3_PHLG1|nr:hypothetical protein PHLGIDRAFT_429124 [Phlebiopsis gigantea 11061_1 CR5-6]